MEHLIQMQSMIGANVNRYDLCSFDQQVIDRPTTPLIHQEARFWFVKEGKAKVLIQNKEYLLTPGSLAAILPWQITKVTEVMEPLQFYLIVYHFDSVLQVMKSFYNISGEPITLEQDISSQPVVFAKSWELPTLDHTFMQLRNELGMKSSNDLNKNLPYNTIAIINHLIAILVYFKRATLSISQNKDEHVLDRSEILQYIFSHCNQKLTLHMISKVFYLSESTISAYITQMTGLSFFDLLNEMRIGKTANFLLYTDFTIEELSEILGYVDASHLSKVFSSRVGMRINEYRTTYQKMSELCKIDESRLVYSIAQHIYRNYATNLLSQQVANEFSITVRQMNKLLMAHIEKNFEEFLNFTRVNRASSLLLKTNRSITDIAFEVGYNTVKSFTRNFIKYRMITPSNFRSNTNITEYKE